MIIIKEAVKQALEKLNDAKHIIKAFGFVLLALVLAGGSIVFSGTRVTYNIKYGGKILANIANVAVYEEGMDKAQAALPKSNLQIAEAEIEKVISVNSKTASSDEVAELILENSPSVLNGYSVSYGDKVIAYVEDKTDLEAALNERLSSFSVKDAECESAFADEIVYTETYFHKDQLSVTSELTASVNDLDVITVASTAEEYVVKYDTITKKDSSKKAGTEIVLTAGVNGSGQIVTKTTYLNGQVSGEPVVEDQLLAYPIDKVVLVGTKNVYITSAPQNASASGFKWPLAIRGVITSYWGDGRNHKGIDIGVPIGTSIIAVKSGTVVESGYSSDYGYHVTIDHGNGVKTRYAHNSKNVVSVGDWVSAGQLIALSGNTGYSTGPHLHFEVHINGNRVNPANYIRL